MQISLRLYITSSSPQSAEAINKVEALRTRIGGKNLQAEIIDLLENPKMAEDDQISVTPTIVVLHPLPSRKIIGSFENLDRELGIKA